MDRKSVKITLKTCISTGQLTYLLIDCFFFRVLDRGFKLKNWHYHQSSHDEQVAVYSCKEFFQGFAFVAIIDFDEIIVNDRFSEYTQILMVTIRRK